MIEVQRLAGKPAAGRGDRQNHFVRTTLRNPECDSGLIAVGRRRFGWGWGRGSLFQGFWEGNKAYDWIRGKEAVQNLLVAGCKTACFHHLDGFW